MGGKTTETIARAKYDGGARRQWTARLVQHHGGKNAGEFHLDYFVPDETRDNGRRRRWRNMGTDLETAKKGFRKFLRNELPGEINRALSLTRTRAPRLRDVRTVGEFRDWYVNRFLDGLGASVHAKRKAGEVLEGLAQTCRSGDSSAISKVSVQEIDSLRYRFRRSFTSRYVRQRETILRQALRVAVVAGLIRRHPVDGWAEDVEYGKFGYLTKAERARIIRRAAEYEELVKEITETGLERAEAAGAYGLGLSTVNRALGYAAAAAGIEKLVTTQTLRDSLLIDALRKGEPLESIAEAMNYKDAASVVQAVDTKRLILEAYLSRV